MKNEHVVEVNGKTVNLEKREKYGIIGMAMINGLFIGLNNGSMVVNILSAISGFAIWSMIVIISVNFMQKDVDKRRVAVKISILGTLWSLSFIIRTVIVQGRLISILNCIALLAFIFNMYTLIKRKDTIREDVDPIKFGAIWLGMVMLIPFMLIGIVLGY